jgi:LuxR family transcriptional regulator, maltose regulon positive regulatory protein
MVGPSTSSRAKSAAHLRDDALATKFKIPQIRRDLLRRPRLIERLNAALDRELTLVCTPAGFGKTTLLAEWAANASFRVAWLSLDHEENDSMRFWRYVTLALQRVSEPTVESITSLVDPPPGLSSRGLVTALINDLEPASDPVALVIDDYHAIESEGIHDDMAFLLSHLPPILHVLITSRADPRLPLARMRARGQMAELREADLRFTPEEVSALFLEVWELDLSPEAVAALQGRTEGWAVGLQLAALSLRERPNPDAFLEAFTGTHRYVLDYLSEEVVERQPHDVSRFLLQTSILDRLSGSLCDAVTRDSNGQEMLEWIERANLFLVPLDHERRWYRFHHLFRDLLRARLRRGGPDQISELNRRAASWCEEQGLLDDAIRYALGSGDGPWAARLVEQHLDETLRHGEEAMLARWLSLLPEEALRNVPALCLAHSQMQLHLGHLDSAERFVGYAELGVARGAPTIEGVPTTGGIVAEVSAAIAIMRGELAAMRGDDEATATHARSALAHMSERERGPRFWARWLLACADWTGGRMVDAERAFAALVVEGRTERDLYPVMSTGSTLARVQRARGELGAALRTYREGLRFVTEEGSLSAHHAGEPHVGIAQVLYERDQLDDAYRHLSEGIELSRKVMVLRERDRGLVTMAWIHQAAGDPVAAMRTMDEACRMYPSADAASLFNPAPSERARLLLAQGKVGQAAQWVEERGLTAADEVSYPHELDLLVLARVLLAKSEPDRALAILERLDALAEAQDRRGSLIQIRALRALALQSAGDHPGALSLLADALALGRPEGYIRVFADEGRQMAALLRSLIVARQRRRVAAASDAAAQHLSQIVVAFKHHGPQGKEGARAPTRLVDPLTDRELEVLRLLAAGRRNNEIAREMVVTVETVKKHVSHILGKLGASSRTLAVARARELGMIS